MGAAGALSGHASRTQLRFQNNNQEDRRLCRGRPSRSYARGRRARCQQNLQKHVSSSVTCCSCDNTDNYSASSTVIVLAFISRDGANESGSSDKCCIHFARGGLPTCTRALWATREQNMGHASGNSVDASAGQKCDRGEPRAFFLSLHPPFSALVECRQQQGGSFG